MEEHVALNLVRELCRALEAAGVVYCHWKSNHALARSASGDNDLDLLVDRASVPCFTGLLCQYGFREARLPAGRQMPGVLDYYGHDAETGKLVHVHAHYQLVLGDDMTKNYCLPIEKPFLAAAVQGDMFRVPIPEFDFIVFVIRMVLKHMTWDAILSRQGGLSARERQELGYLLGQVNFTEVTRLLMKYLPYLDSQLFGQCVLALRPGCSYWARLHTARRLQSCLKACARRPLLVDTLLKLWRRGLWTVQRRVFGYVARKRMASGGVMIAIVGGDGSGKSTAIKGLGEWLSQEFAVMNVHMGKPIWSGTTITVRGILKIGRSLGLYPFMRAPISYSSDPSEAAFPGYPHLLREVCAARDRYWTYRRARCFANNGGLAICDRFPLPQVQYMDGPQVERLAGTHRQHWLVRWLAKLEKGYYRQIAPPDLLIALRVDPETCVRRKTDEDAATVRARARQMWELDWRGTPARIVDASRPQTEVLCELKDLVWSVL